MKTTAKAKYGLQIEGVQILAGDEFNVVGSVTAFKGVIIDLTKYPDAFEITKEAIAAEPMVLEVIRDIQLANGIVIEAGTQFRVVNDIVEVNGGILDIAKFRESLKEIVDDEIIEEPTEAPEAPAEEPTEAPVE